MASDAERAGLRTYQRSECVVFWKTREAYGELSNMAAGFPLVVGKVIVPSSEALYQACRFPHLPQVQSLVICQKSPMTAKMVTKPYRDQSRADWDDVRVALMKWCLKIKLAQHRSKFGAILLGTGDLPIVEQSSKDPFWGAIPVGAEQLRGANVLGRLLMELRELLKGEEARLKTIAPLKIDHFCLLGQPIEIVKTSNSSAQANEAAEQPELFSTPKREALQLNEPSKKAAAPTQLSMFEGTPKMTKEMGRPKKEKLNAPYHVLPSVRGGWDVKKEDNKRASAHFKTKAEATRRGKELANKARVELIVHDRQKGESRSNRQADRASQASLLLATSN